VSADPSWSDALADPGQWNNYSYVSGDPVNYGDPEGLDWCSVDYGMPCFTGSGTVSPFDFGAVGSGNSYVPDPGGLDSSKNKRVQSLNARTHIWMAIPGLRLLLGKWSSTSTHCVTDLKGIGLSVAEVQQYANDSNVKFVNALANQAVLKYMTAYDEKNKTASDFMIPPNGITNTVWVNPNNFWQWNAATLAGSLVHEFAHLANPDASDPDFQTKLLGPAGVDPKNSSNISIKLANDCFKNILQLAKP
jgi:hypothetical protein